MMRYNDPVTSHKGVIGPENPFDRCDNSRSTTQSCGFFVRAPLWRLEWEGCEALPVRTSGRRFSARSSCRQALRSRAAVFKTDRLEAIMAENKIGIATATYILDSWEAEREQIWALASCIERGLQPNTETPRDDERWVEWRVAEIVVERLGCTKHIQTLREMVKGSAA